MRLTTHECGRSLQSILMAATVFVALTTSTDRQPNGGAMEVCSSWGALQLGQHFGAPRLLDQFLATQFWLHSQPPSLSEAIRVEIYITSVWCDVVSLYRGMQMPKLSAIVGVA